MYMYPAARCQLLCRACDTCVVCGARPAPAFRASYHVRRCFDLQAAARVRAKASDILPHRATHQRDAIATRRRRQWATASGEQLLVVHAAARCALMISTVIFPRVRYSDMLALATSGRPGTCRLEKEGCTAGGVDRRTRQARMVSAGRALDPIRRVGCCTSETEQQFVAAYVESRSIASTQKSGSPTNCHDEPHSPPGRSAPPARFEPDVYGFASSLRCHTVTPATFHSSLNSACSELDPLRRRAAGSQLTEPLSAARASPWPLPLLPRRRLRVAAWRGSVRSRAVCVTRATAGAPSAATSPTASAPTLRVLSRSATSSCPR